MTGVWGDEVDERLAKLEGQVQWLMDRALRQVGFEDALALRAPEMPDEAYLEGYTGAVIKIAELQRIVAEG